MTRNYYETLGLERNAEAEIIKTKYRTLALELHPDKNPQDTDAAPVKFQEVRYCHQSRRLSSIRLYM